MCGQVLDWSADWEGPQILCAANLLCDLLDTWQRQTSVAIEDMPRMGHQDVEKLRCTEKMRKPPKMGRQRTKKLQMASLLGPYKIIKHCVVPGC